MRSTITRLSIVEQFYRQYAETALWSSHDYDEDGDTDDCLDALYTREDICAAAQAEMRSDCRSFLYCCHQSGLLADVLANVSRAGHDFWLTRNHHGAGFFDGDWRNGDELTKWAHTFGSSDLYVGDDGEIHVS